MAYGRVLPANHVGVGNPVVILFLLVSGVPVVLGDGGVVVFPS
jgi:hypothetical protein